MEKKFRLKKDPQRVGVWSGGDKHRRIRGGREYYLVNFPNGADWIPASELEEITPATPTMPADLFRGGKLSGDADLRRALTHVRLTGRLTDMIYSMDATNTDFYPHQFKPVVKLLHSPLKGILIADEVGLGKTIEAGLIWKELEARFDYRRLLVLCPASLREKWRDELKNKIGVGAQIADASEFLQKAEGGDDFALVCSHQGMRLPPEDGGKSAKHKLARFLREREGGEPFVDMLIVDEAHHMRNRLTQTRKTCRLLRLASHHIILLTATPVNNKNEDLFSLLNLLTANSDERPEDFGRILEANRPLVELRDFVKAKNTAPSDVRRGIEKAMQNPLLSDSRQLRGLLDYLPPDGAFTGEARANVMHRLEKANLLGHCLTRTMKREVKSDFGVKREPFDHSVAMSPKEAEFYGAVEKTVAAYFGYEPEISPGNVLAMGVPHRMASSCMAAACRRWLSQSGDDDEADDFADGEYGGSDEYSFSGRGGLTRDLCSLCQARFSGEYADALAADDSKYNKLLGIMRDYFDGNPQAKAVLFSEFIGTLSYLQERLKANGVSVRLLKGGLSTEAKGDVVRDFRDNPEVRVLLSSEVGGEGIDLQFSQLLINYDIPWNPMRLEQRIGRLDRLGQKHERIIIWNMFHKGTINEHIYALLQDKLNLCRRAFGGMEPVLAEKVGELTRELLVRGLSDREKQELVEQKAAALMENSRMTEELEKEAPHLVGLGDYIAGQISAARDLHRRIGGGELCRYLRDFLRARYPGSVLENNNGVYRLSLQSDAFCALCGFVTDTNPPVKTRFVRDMNGDVVFGNAATDAKRGAAEVISQYHPLIRFAAANNDKITPAVAVKIPAARDLPPPGVYLIAGALWSYGGAGRTSEKMAYVGEVLNGAAISAEDAEKLANRAVNDGEYWSEYRTAVSAFPSVADSLDELFLSLSDKFRVFADELRDEDADRMEIEQKQVMRHRDDGLAAFDARIEIYKQEGARMRGILAAEEKRRETFKGRMDARLAYMQERRKQDAAESSSQIFAAAILVE